MLLALTVPATNERGPMYMDQALAAIHQANPRRLPLQFELASRDGSLALLCRGDDRLRPSVEQQLYAAYPDLRIVSMGDEAGVQQPHRTWVLDLHLSPDLYPMKRYSQFEDSLNRQTADPLTSLLAALTAGDRWPVSYGIVLDLRPAARRWYRRGERSVRSLARPFLRQHPRIAHRYAEWALSRRLLRRVAARALGRFGRGDLPHGAELHTSAGHLHERETDLQAATNKISGLLFETRLRLYVRGPDNTRPQAVVLLERMAGAFGVFHAAGLSSFHAINNRRAPGHRGRTSFLLSTEEVATLIHLPTSAVRAPTLPSVLSREYEPPVSLPKPVDHRDLSVLGVTAYRGRHELFGILPQDRRRHALIQGKTGMGKTTLLENLITADIHAGRGAALLDPHGDLCDAVLHAIPARRTNDVVLFDAGDQHHPLAFNVLYCDQAEARPLLASGVVSAFKKLYGTFWGPRMEHILRNAVLALLEVPGSTLLSITRLLSDHRFRAGVAARLSDPVVRAFWEREFPSMPARLQAEAVAPVQNKIGAFISSPLLRNIVGQRHNTLHLRELMDGGKILLVNLSKGRVGDDASALLGSFLVTALQVAAMGRADRREDQRREFRLYIDEFQNYATDSFAVILSEARKYGLSLTVANQYLAQLDEATRSAVLGNVGTLISFQIGVEDAELIAEQLGGRVQPQDLLNLPRYTAYARLLIDGMPAPPFSMQTLPPRARHHDPRRAEVIRRTSRHHYTRSRPAVEADITNQVMS